MYLKYAKLILISFLSLIYLSENVEATTSCINADFCVSESDKFIDITISSGFSEGKQLLLKREEDSGVANGCSETDPLLNYEISGSDYTPSSPATINTDNGNMSVRIYFCDGEVENLFCNCLGSDSLNDGKYDLKIYADEDNNGDADEDEEVTSERKKLIIDHLPPETPTPILESGDKTIKVSWSEVSDSNSYNNSGSGIKEYKATLTGPSYSKTITTSNLEAEFEKLQNKVLYTISLAAYDYTGNESISTNRQGVALEIKGFLEGNEGCFIATATYGDYDHPVVKIFRNFRDKILLKSIIGERFVDFYYKYSPFFSKFIIESKFLRFISYIFLLILSFPVGIIVLNSVCVILFLAGIFLLFILMQVPEKFRKNSLFGLFLALLTYPQNGLSKAPSDDDFITPRKKIMIEGDFGSPLRGSQSVKRKYTENETMKKLNPALKKKKDGPKKSLSLIISPMKMSENLSLESRSLYERVYSDKGAYLFMGSYDYNLFRKMIGILSLNFSFGLYRDGGYGFRNEADVQAFDGLSDMIIKNKSDTSFYFNVVPLEFGLSYRARFHPKQFFVPFGVGALGYYPFTEARVDRNSGLWGNYGAGKVLSLSGGIEINITGWSKKVRSTFINTYSIYDAHITLQAKIVRDLVKSGNIAFESNRLMGGIMFEF